MTTRVEGVGDNAREVSVVGNVGGVSRSTDYQDNGVKARDGFNSRSVSSPDQLRDNEIIEVQGMSMKVSQAKELGLLGQVFDESLSAGAAAQAAAQRQEAPKSETGAPEYDAAIASLEADIESGTVTLEEAREYDTALAQVAMAGLSFSDVVETIDGLDNGTVDSNAVPGEVKSMISAVEASVEKAAITSAKSEIGAEGFAELKRAATASPEVAAAVRSYAVLRATGKADGIRWSDLLADVRDHLKGVR